MQSRDSSLAVGRNFIRELFIRSLTWGIKSRESPQSAARWITLYIAFISRGNVYIFSLYPLAKSFAHRRLWARRVLDFHVTDKILGSSLFLASCSSRTWLFRPTIRSEAHENARPSPFLRFYRASLMYVSYRQAEWDCHAQWKSRRCDIIALQPNNCKALFQWHLMLDAYARTRSSSRERKRETRAWSSSWKKKEKKKNG